MELIFCCVFSCRTGERGTGFIGYLPLHKSRYLLTCHHVLPGGRLEKKTIREADFTFDYGTDEGNAISYKGYQLFKMDRLVSFTSPVKITKVCSYHAHYNSVHKTTHCMSIS